MEKKLYELKISESLEHLMPPLSVVELRLLRASLISEGCRDPLVTWNGTLVDGHNRYRLCHEHGIPFNCVEMQFADEAEAQRWIIRNQLARRNVPDYVRCELVLPLEAELKAEGKARQRQYNRPDMLLANLPKAEKRINTRSELAKAAGVSDGTFKEFKKIAATADEATKDKLRKGELSIHGAYTALRQEDPERPQRIHNSRVILPPERSAEHLAPPSDDVYAQPPISAVPPADVSAHDIAAAIREAGARYLEDVLGVILNATPEELAATGDELLAEAEKTHRAVIAAIGDARIDKGGDDGM